jgi:hypothetical protein
MTTDQQIKTLSGPSEIIDAISFVVDANGFSAAFQ